MSVVAECLSVCLGSSLVTSGLVAGLFQHKYGVTFSDYCFNPVSDVYVPLGALQPVLSRPGRPRAPDPGSVPLRASHIGAA